jgi:hypothetical protein
MLRILERWLSSHVRGINLALLDVEENKITQGNTRRDFEPLGFKVISVLSTKNAWQSLEIGLQLDLRILDFIFSTDEGRPHTFSRISLDKWFSSTPSISLPSSLNNELFSSGIKILGEAPTRSAEIISNPYALFISGAITLHKNHMRLLTAFRGKLRHVNKLSIGRASPITQKKRVKQ